MEIHGVPQGTVNKGFFVGRSSTESHRKPLTDGLIWSIRQSPGARRQAPAAAARSRPGSARPVHSNPWPAGRGRQTGTHRTRRLQPAGAGPERAPLAGPADAAGGAHVGCGADRLSVSLSRLRLPNQCSISTCRISAEVGRTTPGLPLVNGVYPEVEVHAPSGRVVDRLALASGVTARRVGAL